MWNKNPSRVQKSKSPSDKQLEEDRTDANVMVITTIISNRNTI